MQLNRRPQSRRSNHADRLLLAKAADLEVVSGPWDAWPMLFD